MYVNFVNICVNDILVCVVLEWHNAFYMYWGNLRKLGVSAQHERNKKYVIYV